MLRKDQTWILTTSDRFNREENIRTTKKIAWRPSGLLLHDGSADALGLFKNFVGREPYIEPLLKRRGLEKAPGADDTKQPAELQPPDR